MKTIIEAINEAIKESLIRGIKTNTIILNENYDLCKEFYFSIAPERSVIHITPMILGKSVCLMELPKDYAFAIANTNLSQNCETIFNENQLLKKYLKLVGEGDNQCLVFKGVSSKKNKEDFNKIKEILGYGTEN